MERLLEGSRIGFIGRGGSGKSTVIALLAKALRRRGYAVCVLDADSTNLGLHKALGLERAPQPLMSYFGGMVFQGGRVSCPVDDPSRIAHPEIDLVELPPEYRVTLDGVTLLQAGKLADFGIGAGCDGPMVKVARDLRVRDGGKPAVLLVDFKAGLEDSSRGALVGMDAVVVVCDPSLAGIHVAITFSGMLAARDAGSEPATAHLEEPGLAELLRRLYREWRSGIMEVVLNKVTDAETEACLREKLAAHGIEPAAVLYDSGDLRRAWLRGTELNAPVTDEALAMLAQRLEQRLASAGD
jgi:CO dehydrogenase nickel-insertion accessory protein CooC1